MTDDARRTYPPRGVYLAAVLAVFLVLCLALAICFVGSPRPAVQSAPPIEPSDAAAQSAETKFYAVADAPLGPFAIDISDQEATSFLALRVPGSPILSPQVRFSGGKAYISGKMSLGVLLNMTTQWAVSGDGRPRLVLERAAFGPLAMPSLLLSSVSSTVNEMIDESGTGVFPTRVVIAEGHALIEGEKLPPTVP